MIIYNKLDNYFFVSDDRQTFLGFEMTANLHDTSLLRPLHPSPKLKCTVDNLICVVVGLIQWNFCQFYDFETGPNETHYEL